MCGPFYNEPHDPNCCCDDCMPDPSYWNGIDPDWYVKELRRRESRKRRHAEDNSHYQEWGP